MIRIPPAAIDHLAITRSFLRALEMMVPSLTTDVSEQEAVLALNHLIDQRLAAVMEGDIPDTNSTEA